MEVVLPSWTDFIKATYELKLIPRYLNTDLFETL